MLEYKCLLHMHHPLQVAAGDRQLRFSMDMRTVPLSSSSLPEDILLSVAGRTRESYSLIILVKYGIWGVWEVWEE